MQGLGDLEGAAMEALWRSDMPMSVREVLTELNRSRRLAYTTVMTVLDNLHRKGWVDRELSGRAYQYAPREGKQEATSRAVRELLESSGDPEGVLLHFAQSASDEETAVLRRGLRRSRK